MGQAIMTWSKDLYAKPHYQVPDLSGDCVEDLLVPEDDEARHICHDLTLQELLAHINLNMKV